MSTRTHADVEALREDLRTRTKYVKKGVNKSRDVYKQVQGERSRYGEDAEDYRGNEYIQHKELVNTRDPEKKGNELLEEIQARDAKESQLEELSDDDAMDMFQGHQAKSSGFKKHELGAAEPKRSKKVSRIVVDDSEEVVKLCDSFKLQLKQVRDRVLPLLERLRKAALPTNKGLSYLEVKLHLLLAYCIDVAFYLLLKTSGRSIKDHPVIEQLVLHRTFLQRLSSLDSKLKYQIDKLLRMAATGAVDNGDLAHRPTLDLDDEDEEEPDRDAKYKAVQNLPEHISKKREKIQDKRRRQAQRTGMSDFLLEEFGDAPEEGTTTGLDDIAKSKAHAKLLRKQREWEEDNYKRAKGIKKSRVKPGQFNPLAGIESFGDIAKWEQGKQDSLNIPEFAQIKGQQEDASLKAFFDAEPATVPAKGVKRKQPTPSDDGMDEDMGLGDMDADDLDDDDMDFLQEHPNKKQRLSFDYYDDTVEKGSKRGITDEMRRARGTVKRTRSNPRVKAKKRYEKRSKRSGQVKMRDRTKAYTGEGGITDTKYVRSRQYKE